MALLRMRVGHVLLRITATAQEDAVKVIVRSEYGSPDVLQLKEVAKPIPKDNELLVRVHASSVNSADVENLRGTFVVRMGGPRRPKHKILGSDIAGRSTRLAET